MRELLAKGTDASMLREMIGFAAERSLPFSSPRRTAEKALTAVIQQAYVHGVWTRAVDDLVQAMGASGVIARCPSLVSARGHLCPTDAHHHRGLAL